MNEKEIGEIRRRFRPDKNNISRIRGCYVNEKKEIISEFNQSLALMSEAETEQLLAILRKTLSGTLAKNLIDIEFSTQQVLEGEAHRRLTALRSSSLEDDAEVSSFFSQTIDALTIEGNYLILLANDSYDVPAYRSDGTKEENSAGIFSYILCSICPVKLTKSALGYHSHENRFCNITQDWAVSAPELGFMFPAFDNREANIYNAVYYTRNAAENHQEFAEAVFQSEVPMPAAVQKEKFDTLLGEVIAEDCSYDVVRAVHGEINERIEDYKASKGRDEEPPVIKKDDVKGILQSCGIGEERIHAFENCFDAEFGEKTALIPGNIIDTRQFELCTPDVTVRVNPERTDLVMTKIIDGVRYILIRADESVEVNGINIHIS